MRARVRRRRWRVLSCSRSHGGCRGIGYASAQPPTICSTGFPVLASSVALTRLAMSFPSSNSTKSPDLSVWKTLDYWLLRGSGRLNNERRCGEGTARLSGAVGGEVAECGMGGRFGPPFLAGDAEHRGDAVATVRQHRSLVLAARTRNVHASVEEFARRRVVRYPRRWRFGIARKLAPVAEMAPGAFRGAHVLGDCIYDLFARAV